MKREPVVIWSSILVVLQVLAAGAALSDTIGKDSAALVALIVAALQAGTQFYIRGIVSPVDDTAELREQVEEMNRTRERVAEIQASIAADRDEPVE